MRGTRSSGRRRRARVIRRLRRAVDDQRGFGLTEMLVASTIGSIGFMAVASLQLAAATQGRIAEWRTSQALAAQQVFEEIHRQGYTAATSGSYNTTVGSHQYAVSVTVSNTAIRVKQVTALVPGVGSLNSQTYVTRLYELRPVPAGP